MLRKPYQVWSDNRSKFHSQPIFGNAHQHPVIFPYMVTTCQHPGVNFPLENFGYKPSDNSDKNLGFTIQSSLEWIEKAQLSNAFDPGFDVELV